MHLTLAGPQRRNPLGLRLLRRFLLRRLRLAGRRFLRRLRLAGRRFLRRFRRAGLRLLRGFRTVEGDRLANERLEGGLVDFSPFEDVDRATYVSFETRVEETGRI